MVHETTQKLRKELNAGTAALAVLAAVERAGRAVYGYELAGLLERAAGGKLPMGAGALYPVLRSLARQGLLEASSVPSESGPPRRYYAITGEGRRVLVEWVQAWRNTQGFLEAVLGGSAEMGESGGRDERTASGGRGGSVSGGTRKRAQAHAGRGSR